MAFTHQNEKINSTGDDEKPFIIYHIPLIKFDCRVIFHFKRNRSMTYFKGIGAWGFFFNKEKSLKFLHYNFSVVNIYIYMTNDFTVKKL